MAAPPLEEFHAVRPQAAGRRQRARVVFLAGSFVLGLIAVMALVAPGKSHPESRSVSKLFSMPSISLGIREHEGVPAPIAPADRDPTSKIAKGTNPTSPMQLDTQATARYNYQMGNDLTWPPHDTDYIPTGAYSAGYKGPYDNDYNWPDDTQVLRNDEWVQAGGVGCGMTGNNC
ncbi:hypothetical protein GUITHDRAFT_150564 [Guillardia theta CCMP2712]|uniref:Uncharacterized protein n=1 Tax=Guillardia theta (strain CCMP2712) TaxID=905079 RepID=L1JVS5_GUITC|nr:hypothetical protein GUITHDRAFT_150564 [Guillardia theta CCMP2712]EKX52487.1 hypothetical protein GUITHDRAFT_150564 [Guillardia theta CCMP2712]|mmetsp:Transcript_32750/g.103627  ORF Transcript_32750/g.103627 Transcript_32750/m.103627 type:complete len:174 (-) Transcript_32750:176-697(-)|eukprot:XP_005839467.1 hypothetical protein GUITHDRAFT_150564 [Guillardia theta CCMP2712]